MDLNFVERALMVDAGMITKERMCELFLGGARETEQLQSLAGAERSRAAGERGEDDKDPERGNDDRACDEEDVTDDGSDDDERVGDKGDEYGCGGNYPVTNCRVITVGITGNYLSQFSSPGNCRRRTTTCMQMIVRQLPVSHELRGFS